jgi:hypothetical protein
MSEQLDLLPNVEHLINASENHKGLTGICLPGEWSKDQKPDFYLGFFASYRVFLSTVIHLQKIAETEEAKDMLEALEIECLTRFGEVANILLDKYELKGF